MEIAVFVEPVPGSGYRARLGEPLGLTAEGSTPEAALANVEALVRERQAAGGRFMAIHVPGPEHPLAKFAGIFENDPWFDRWQQAIEDYRRQVDDDPTIP